MILAPYVIFFWFLMFNKARVEGLAEGRNP